MARITRNSFRTLTTRHTLIAGVMLGAMTLGGCASYTNVPEPESAPAFNSANHLQAKKATKLALEEIVDRYPMRGAQGRYTVNLPEGTSLETAQEIVSDLPEGVVIPFEGMDTSIPVYHIGRIWIRASTAKVDVLYPARSFDGSDFIGNATVWMRGGIQRWRVQRVQHWAPGTIRPAPIYIPIPKAELEAMGEGSDEEYTGSESSPPEAEPMQDEAPAQPADDGMVDDAPEFEQQAEPSGNPGNPYREVPIDD